MVAYVDFTSTTTNQIDVAETLKSYNVIIFAFATLAEGTINPEYLDQFHSILRSYVQEPHDKNTKFLISLGGAISDKFDLSTDISRDKIIKGLITTLQQNKELDGVDLDIENQIDFLAKL